MWKCLSIWIIRTIRWPRMAQKDHQSVHQKISRTLAGPDWFVKSLLSSLYASPCSQILIIISFRILDSHLWLIVMLYMICDLLKTKWHKQFCLYCSLISIALLLKGSCIQNLYFESISIHIIHVHFNVFICKSSETNIILKIKDFIVKSTAVEFDLSFRVFPRNTRKLKSNEMTCSLR